MPRLGESVTEGTVTRWLKKEGERVEADEPLLEVSTDKVDTEIPAPASGVLSAIKVGEDETVEVGVELAVIDDASGATGDAAPAKQESPEPEQQEQPPAQAQQPQWSEPASARSAEPAKAEQPAEQPRPAAPQQSAPSQQPAQAPAPAAQPQTAPAPQAAPQPAAAQTDADVFGGAYVTPLVRKLAAEHDVNLSGLAGTGVGGRIRKQDVLEAARAKQASPAQPEAPQAPAAQPAGTPSRQPARVAASPLRGTTEKMSRLRTVIAHRMVESMQVSAQLTTVVEVDVTGVARLRSRAKADFEAREGVRLSFLPFFAVATVEALKQHPKVNGSIDVEAGTITYHEAEHLGIAVDTERGLLVPVIHNAGDLNLGGMARKIADLAERTRANRVSPDELAGGTFTLTNTGSRGALFDTPIINQPQVGILGTGSVVKRPVVVDDPNLGEVVAVRSMVYLALSYDHRLVDGADAARFLGTIKDRLEGGAFEADLGLA
ncbi:MAG TPA: 2-oxoglutarate dehydrogenase, E2 component, dihydrolipoamide succinyltransferase [Mycobacteriales bacterium]|nr:2-oxoglutarate dehydrogenase, E2 component, dihydrolipoamide succinyltransferase [Mycobacteriales bacterium]